MRISYLVSSIFFLLSLSKIRAQKAIISNNQQWVQYYNQFRLSSKMTLISDVSLRHRRYLSEMSQFSLRSGVGYSFNSKFNGITGFANFFSFQDNALSRIEYRFFQEVNNTSVFSFYSVQNRFRIEYRIFKPVQEGKFLTSIHSNFRFRYRVYFTTKGIKIAKRNSSKLLSLNMGDEIFLNAGSSVANQIFDNNRILIGPTFQFSKVLSVSFLFNHQYGQRSGVNLYENSNVLWIIINHKGAL